MFVNLVEDTIMISLLLATALSQAPAPTPIAAIAPAPAAAPVAVIAPAQAVAVDGEDAKKSAKNDERTGCVERTGSRIRRHDKANCDNGRSISAEDIERAGGQLAPYAAPAVPAAAGN
jgi:hypothetical protein